MRRRIIDEAAGAYAETIRLRPWASILLSIILLVIPVALGYYGFRFAEGMVGEDYLTQIDRLDVAESNLQDLIEFIQAQKVSLTTNEQALNKLKLEMESLQPLVEADRKVVEALFIAQEQRAKSQLWLERFFGFLVGVISSLAASFFIKVYEKFKST